VVLSKGLTRIYLIRHAEAQGNIERIFQGHSNGDVSENGIKQLERLSERCKSLNFDAVYSSPLQRAYKTAEAANIYHNLPITTLESLMEINGGHWEGKLFNDLPTLFPDEHEIWENEPWLFKAYEGESMQEVYERIWGAVQGIVLSHPNKSVCVVSHGCAIRNFLCRAYGKELCELATIDWCDNTAISIIDFDENLNAQVVISNDASHLDDELSTISKQDWWKKSKGGAKQ
jgi:broad specificity phosphatase PhoE